MPEHERDQAGPRHTVASGTGEGRQGGKRERPLSGNPSIELAVLVRGPRAVEVIARFAQNHGLTVLERQPARRLVILSGPANAVAEVFGVRFTEYQSGRATYRDVKSEPTLPEPFAAKVAFVHGLETRPETRKPAGREGELLPVASVGRPGNLRGQKLGPSPPDRTAEIVILLSNPTASGEVATFAASNNLKVIETNDARRLMVLSGRLEDLGRAFNVAFERYGLNGRAYRVIDKPPTAPANIAADILFVHGLETPPRVGVRRLALPGAVSIAPRIGARRVGDADPDEMMQVTIVLRARPRQRIMRRAVPLLPSHRRHLSRPEFVAQRGALPRQLDRVEAFAVRQGLRVVSRDAARRTVVVTGRVRDIMRAFRIRLAYYAYAGRNYRGIEVGQNVTLPFRIAPLVLAVLGLENLPVARPHIRPATVSPHASFSPVQIAARYQFPSGGASGQTIGIIELGGGFNQSELTNYFAGLGVPQPTVIAIGVDGATNSPTGNPNSEDGEVVLDIEVAGAVAPGANIAVYFAPNTDQGFFDAVSEAIHDTQNNPSVLSISWGLSEDDWTPAGRDALNQALADAAPLGITVFAASGDDGSKDNGSDGQNHVDFPASSPFVTGCGGTSLLTSGESAWSGSGGGVSNIFDRPPWQAGVPVPPPSSAQGGRGVPDVSANADPDTGYQNSRRWPEHLRRRDERGCAAVRWLDSSVKSRARHADRLFQQPAVHDPPVTGRPFRHCDRRQRWIPSCAWLGPGDGLGQSTR